MNRFIFEADIPTLGHVSEEVEVKENESDGVMLILNEMKWLLKQFNVTANKID